MCETGSYFGLPIAAVFTPSISFSQTFPTLSGFEGVNGEKIS